MENKVVTPKITPNLWFDVNAEEAVHFYLTIFKNSKINAITRYDDAGFEFHRMPSGTIMTIDFELDSQSFVALNGGPMFSFTEAVSFIVNCDTQEEIDYYWDALKVGGDEKAQICGWLKDKFGVSWQIVPNMLTEVLRKGNNKHTSNMMNAMMQMKKLEISKLQEAYSHE